MDETLKKELEELYVYYHKLLRKLYSTESDKEMLNENVSFEEAKAYGAQEAIGAIYLSRFGGKEMFALWQRCLNDDPETGN